MSKLHSIFYCFLFSSEIYNSDNVQDEEREEITTTNDVMSVNNTQQSVMQYVFQKLKI